MWLNSNNPGDESFKEYLTEKLSHLLHLKIHISKILSIFQELL